MRPREFLDVLDDPELPRCEVTGEQAEMLRRMLVHLFFADLDFDSRELKLLKRVIPDVNTRDYVKAIAAQRLDLERLAIVFPDPTDRDDIVTLAEHAMSTDGKVERREWSLVTRLRETLGVSRPPAPHHARDLTK